MTHAQLKALIAALIAPMIKEEEPGLGLPSILLIALERAGDLIAACNREAAGG